MPFEKNLMSNYYTPSSSSIYLFSFLLPLIDSFLPTPLENFFLVVSIPSPTLFSPTCLFFLKIIINVKSVTNFTVLNFHLSFLFFFSFLVFYTTTTSFYYYYHYCFSPFPSAPIHRVFFCARDFIE